MKVTLRERNQGKTISLFLDFYDKGKRRKKSLSIYLEPNPKNKRQRDINKQKREIAELKRNEMELALLKGELKFEKLGNQEFVSFYDYLQKEANKRIYNPNTYANWQSMIKHFKAFRKEDLDISEVDRNLANDFRYYIDNKAKSLKGNGKSALSASTKNSYFNKFKAALKEAYQQELIEKDVNRFVKGFPEPETERSYLVPHELQQLADSECESPLIKAMFLFSCITGMPYSDIKTLKMEHVHEVESGKYRYYFNRQKTDGSNYLPISVQAKKILDSVHLKNKALFSEVKDHKMIAVLKSWIPDSRFNKHITFHCARHTFAVMQLAMGTDIATLQKLMGHKNISTTMIYAKIVDKLKEDAIEKTNIINLKLI